MPGSEPLAISVVLPAYNEARNLEVLLPRLRATLSAIGVASEIIVVDTVDRLDDTREICVAYDARHIRRRGGDSYGNAIRTGIAETLGERVVIMDTDGSHDPEFVRTLWEHRDDADVVIASRYIMGGATENPWLLVALSRILNAVFSVVVAIPARDISNSFRIYRGSQLRSIDLVSQHFDVQEEILARLLWEIRPSATIAEVPFRFKAREFGESKRNMRVFVGAFLGAMVRLRRLRTAIRDEAHSK